MRIGINAVWDGFEPEQWADTVIKMGFTASSFPVDYKEPVSRIDAFVKAAKDRDILIAEVGAWCSPFLKNEKAAQAGRERCFEQLRLADYVKANCCVNVSGAVGDIWFGCYAENYAEELYKRNVELRKIILDTYLNYSSFLQMGKEAEKYYNDKCTVKNQANGFIEAIEFVKKNVEF